MTRPSRFNERIPAIQSILDDGVLNTKKLIDATGMCKYTAIKDIRMYKATIEPLKWFRDGFVQGWVRQRKD